MPVFYFSDPLEVGDNKSPVVYELSCTTEVTISSPAKVTSSAVEDGGSIVDNYYLDNRVVTFDGLITNIRVSGQLSNPSTEQWIKQIRELRKTKHFLTVTADSEVVPNCLITEFNLSKTNEHGLSAWAAKISFKEVDISTRARLVEVKDAKKAVKDVVEAKTKGGGSPTKEVLTTTVGLDAYNAGVQAASAANTGYLNLIANGGS
jgi:hypothetical protein